MRLNFAGVGEDDLREGIRRIGKVVREQVRLYGTLTGTAPATKRTADTERTGSRPRERADEPDPTESGARVLPLRRRAAGER